MEPLMTSLIDGGVQCWGCPIFDRVFQVVSNAGAAIYRPFSTLVILLFAVLIAFYVLYAVLDNLGIMDRFRNLSGPAKVKDATYFNEYFKSILINGLVVVSLLGLGIYVPRFISTVTFEPVTDVAIFYTQSMLHTDTNEVEEKVIYQPAPMEDNGFYRPALRDKIILLMKTTITQFQSMISLGFAVMDGAFSWDALRGIGAFIQHIMMFIMGLYLVYAFFRIFIKFCFYFIDTIVALALFAFFFPLSLMLFVFKNSKGPKWLTGLGDGMKNNFKNVINAIVTLGAVVITYSVVMVLIAKFFASNGISGVELYGMITDGKIYSGLLDKTNLGAITLSACIVLTYVVQVLFDQVPKIAENIMKVFDIERNDKLGEGIGEDVLKLSKAVFDGAKGLGKTLLGKGPAKEEKK